MLTWLQKGTKRTWNRNSEDDTGQSNINVNITEEEKESAEQQAGSGASASSKLVGDEERPVAIDSNNNNKQALSQDKNGQTAGQIKK